MTHSCPTRRSSDRDRAEGIGDELERERLTTRPVGEDNVVTGEHVRATLNQADGGSLGKIEAGDAEAGKGLQLARIGLAILVRILPDAERGELRVGRSELAV